MNDNPAPSNLPLGTAEDTRAGRGTSRVEWAWNGKRYYAEAKPHTWGVEKRAVRACSDAQGIDPGAFVEFMLANLVEESNAPLKGVEIVGRDPDFVWTAARALGVMDHLKRIGVKLLSDDAARMTIQDVAREYLLIEARLRRSGHSVAEIEQLPAEDVRALYETERAERTAEIERQAAIVGNIIASRLGA